MSKNAEGFRISSIFRWLVLVISVVIAALYLNSALYSAWVSGGPPNDYPEVWAQRSLRHFCLALALPLLGLAFFQIIRPVRPRWPLSLLYAGIAFGLLAVPIARMAYLRHACDAAAGKWSDAYYRCEHK